ncbi:aminotransferase class IV [Mesorhizobium sp. M6A.T.Ce.TU.016.01.1.1]|uniref:aminotransferase class IV n=1 Tax=Mesorhizobium sp. M6A.T.Ce.TU.016.01.1.1 TaxID=2496783 RepID=UPI000FCB960E|nr:aminotransferase class IV [Mesorhizobium sp. M6A.T.Ce.TU.016.01.1.1]RUU32404.1 branched-chain amino acid aminotransferase [Mesorhizobium sp. M6A.T.Ce.TU.016.01.1.1]
MSRFLWRSGRILPFDEATVHVRSVGHASVSAVFEGINAYWSDALDQLHVFRLRDHLQRLIESTQLSRLEVGHTVAELEAATLELLRCNDVRSDVHIRPWSFAAGDPTEQMVPAEARSETVIDMWPFASALHEPRTRTAAVTSWSRISANATPPRAKAFANYHNGRLGNIDAQSRGADWPIFLNERFHVTESSGATIGLVLDGVFHTPALSSGILHSVTRATVINLLREDLGKGVVERDVDRTDLYLADEVMFLGTSAEILPIVAIDGRPVRDGCIGPLTAKLRTEYRALVRGERPERAAWLTPVWPR